MLVKREVDRLHKLKENIDKQIKFLQLKCSHDWELIYTGNNDDGWSVNIDITYTKMYKCLICGANKTEETNLQNDLTQP